MIEGDSKNTLLVPSEALTRFVPSEQFGSIRKEKLRGDVRYGIRIGRYGLVINNHHGCEVLNQAELCNIPNSPSWFAGAINLRGNIVPVFDLKLYFNDGKERTPHTRIIVIGKGESAVGILIDEFPEVLRDLPEATAPVELPDLLAKHVLAAYAEGEDRWIDFAFDSFFTELGRQISWS